MRAHVQPAPLPQGKVAPVNQDALLYFHRLCQLGSFSATAASIPMTTQGLRKTIHALEAELDTKLYHGTREGVVITEGGRLVDAFYEQVEPIARQLERDLARLRGDGAKTLSVGFSFGMFNLVSNVVLDRLEHDCGWEIEFTSLPDRNLAQEMELGTFDFALTWGEVGSDALTYEHVADLPVYAVGRRDNPLVSDGSIRIEDFDGRAVVSIGDFYKPHRLFMAACAAAGAEPSRVLEANEMPVTQAYLRQNLGVGLALSLERLAYDTELFAFVPVVDFTLPMGISYQTKRAPKGFARELADALADGLRKQGKPSQTAK